MNIPPNTIVDLLKIVLGHNYFQFADTMYHQVQGTAMGTKMAPSYANIFMAELEEYLLDNYSTKPLLWKRYIDDILCIWPGPPSEVEDFIQYLNQSHPTIKFTHSSSTTEVDFLDLTIYKGKRHAASLILDLKPFFKPTNKFQYLEYSSAHHRGTFPSLIKGELTRLLRACSDERTYKKAADVILSKFKKRGYPNSLLQRILQQVPFQNRTELFNREKEVKQTYDTFFKINYTPDLDTRSLRKILQPHEQEAQIPTPCLSLSTTDNLAKKLVKAKLKQCPDPPKSTTPITIKITKPDHSNSKPCRIPSCKCCATISNKCRVTSTHNNKTYPTQRYTCCSTRNIVYLIECTKCTKGNQYVGHTTQTLRTKLAEHQMERTVKSNLPLYKHFSQKKDHDFNRDIRFTILQVTTKSHLLEATDNWIKSLNTTFPKGLNHSNQ